MTDLTLHGNHPPEETDWLRLEDTYGDNGPRVYLRRFRVLRHTPCGVWIRDFSIANGERWVSNTTRIRYAYPTYELALDSYQHRKRDQKAHLMNRLDHVNKVLQMLEEGLDWKDYWGDRIAEPGREPGNPFSL